MTHFFSWVLSHWPVAAVVACLCKYLVCNEILSRAVRIDDGLDKVLRNVIVVGEKLLGVLRKAISAVAEEGIVVLGADSRIQTKRHL